MARHWHAMAGMHGCMPNMNEVCRTKEDAISTLVQVHDEARGLATELRRNHSAKINLRRDGNEYCEIFCCHEEDCEEDF